MDNADNDVVLHDSGVTIPVEGVAEDGGGERDEPRRLLRDALCCEGESD